jgi:(2Fe-2S) ferredoxin
MDHAITVCEGTSCLRKREAGRFHTLLLEQLKEHGLQDKVKINISGCLGMCAKGPLMVVNPGYTIYGGLKDKDVAEIVEQHLIKHKPVVRLVVEEDHLYNRFFRVFGDVGFFGKQMRITLRNCGIIDPENIDDYLALRGYEALAKVLAEMTPQQVIEEVKKSGLRGRGGAGFPTGLKWELTAREKSPEKYVICNADEGDPGAFMDRSAIEGDPHTVL